MPETHATSALNLVKSYSGLYQNRASICSMRGEGLTSLQQLEKVTRRNCSCENKISQGAAKIAKWKTGLAHTLPYRFGNRIRFCESLIRHLNNRSSITPPYPIPTGHGAGLIASLSLTPCQQVFLFRRLYHRLIEWLNVFARGQRERR